MSSYYLYIYHLIQINSTNCTIKKLELFEIFCTIYLLMLYMAMMLSNAVINNYRHCLHFASEKQGNANLTRKITENGEMNNSIWKYFTFLILPWRWFSRYDMSKNFKCFDKNKLICILLYYYLYYTNRMLLWYAFSIIFTNFNIFSLNIFNSKICSFS